MSGVRTPLFEVVEDDHPDRPTQSAKRALVELRPDLRARVPHQEPHRFSRVAQRQDEEADAPVLARVRVTDHRPVAAIVDLAFLARRRGDDDAGLGRRRATEREHKAADARIPRDETVVVDQVVPDRHGVPTAAHRLGDQLAIRLAGTRTRRAAGAWDGGEVGGHLRCGGRFCPIRVGGHLRRNGRFCRRVGGHPRRGGRFWRPHPRPATPATHRDPGRLQIVAGRLSAYAGGRFDAPQRPTESPQCDDLLLSVITQDVAHGGVGACAPRCRQRLGPLRVVAGFQVSINGRFWVSTEVMRFRTAHGVRSSPESSTRMGLRSDVHGLSSTVNDFRTLANQKASELPVTNRH
jgi:hypothetical protein